MLELIPLDPPMYKIPDNASSVFIGPDKHIFLRKFEVIFYHLSGHHIYRCK